VKWPPPLSFLDAYATIHRNVEDRKATCDGGLFSPRQACLEG
jgi:hypothetical protein